MTTTPKQNQPDRHPSPDSPLGPEPDRAAIEALEPNALVMLYRSGLSRMDTRAVELTDAQLDRGFDAEAGLGLWPVRVLLWHLADCEMLYTQRIRGVLSTEGPVFADFDEHAPIEAGLYGGGVAFGGDSPIAPPAGAAVALIYTIRSTQSAILAQLPPEAWERRGMHPVFGEMTLKQFVAWACYHLEHHIRFLNAKVESMLGPKPEGGCCGGTGECGGEGCSSEACGHSGGAGGGCAGPQGGEVAD